MYHLLGYHMNRLKSRWIPIAGYFMQIDVLDYNMNVKSRASSDRSGEAKACGNLGNTLKVLNKFDEALAFCHRQQDIAREFNEKVI